MVENPACWKPADKIVADAYQDWTEMISRGMCGYSLPRHITNALRTSGHLHDDHEPEIGWEGLRHDAS